MGPRAVPPVGTDASQPVRPRCTATPTVMQFPSEFEWIAPSGTGRAHALHAGALLGRLVDGLRADARPRPRRRCTSCSRLAEAGRRDAQRAAARSAPTTRRRTSGSPRSTGTGTPATSGRGSSARSARSSSPRSARSSRPRAGRRVAAEPRHEPGLHRQGRLLHRHQAGAARRPRHAVADAEKFATFAALHGARFPHAALDKAWRQLLFGAHHDAITGSEADQVYLDLLAGWRDAWTAGGAVLDAAAAATSVSQVDTSGPASR